MSTGFGLKDQPVVAAIMVAVKVVAVGVGSRLGVHAQKLLTSGMVSFLTGCTRRVVRQHPTTSTLRQQNLSCTTRRAANWRCFTSRCI